MSWALPLPVAVPLIAAALLVAGPVPDHFVRVVEGAGQARHHLRLGGGERLLLRLVGLPGDRLEAGLEADVGEAGLDELQGRIAELEAELADLQEQSSEMKAHWQNEKEAIGAIRATKEQIEQAKSLGINGFVVDWYGPKKSFIDTSYSRMQQVADGRGFAVALMYDEMMDDPARMTETIDVVKSVFTLKNPVSVGDVYAPGFVGKGS